MSTQKGIEAQISDIDHHRSSKHQEQTTNLIHLGAGFGSDIPNYISRGISQVYLYEGEPSTYENLCDTVKAYDHVSAYCEVVAASKTPTSFYCNQPAQFSGIHTDWLQVKLKNLRQRECKQVEPLTLECIVKRHPEITQGIASNTLILELNGSECDVINQSSESVLKYFDVIVFNAIRGTKDSEYQKQKILAVANLLNLGFEVYRSKSTGLFESYQFVSRHCVISPLIDRHYSPEPAFCLLNDVYPVLARINFDKHQSRVIELEGEIAEYQQNAIEEIISLSDSIISLEDEKEQLVDANTELAKKNATLLEALDEARNQIQQLVEAQKVQQEKEKSLASNVSSLKSKVADLTTDRAQLSEDNSALVVERDEARNQVQQLVEAKKVQQAKEKELASNVSSLESKVASLTTDRAQLSEDNSALMVERDEARSQTQQLVEEQKEQQVKEKELASCVSSLESKVASLMKDSDQLTKDNATSVAERNEAHSQIANKSQQIEEMQKASKVKEGELRSQISKQQLELEIVQKNKIAVDSIYVKSSLESLVESGDLLPLLTAGYFPEKNTNDINYLKFNLSSAHSELFVQALDIVGNNTKLCLLDSLYVISLLVSDAVKSLDLHKKTDEYLLDPDINDVDKFVFCSLMASEMKFINNELMIQNFINLAKEYVWGDDVNRLHLFLFLSKCFEIIGRKNDAALMMFGLFESDFGVNKSDINNIFFDSYERISSNFKKSQHGHDVLLDYLKANTKCFFKSESRKPIIIEIGTTREFVSGQGSTLEIAKFCFENDFDFITVDMDEHNSRVANAGFKKYGYPFEAITMKGEDFLSEYTNQIDVLFLDAYDFDHGNHSELRQERYQKFLGSRIDEELCHKMHLECVENVLNKMEPHGIICIDDTWIENGSWTAKGTTAVPYLMANGFDLIEGRNRAALFQIGVNDRISEK